MANQPSYVRTRLSALFFIEFFIWATWFVPIAGYGAITLQLKGSQMGWIFSATAIGAIISPLFIGYVADRLFATEKVLAVLHLIGGVCLLLAAGQTSFLPLITLLMINALCFMPTLALANSLAFRNIPDPDKFPRIAVFGTIGWIASGLIVAIVFGGESRNWFFYLAGATGILMAGYCLTLPHTPPKGREEAGGDVLGFGALGLLKEPAFLLFVVCAFLVTIPAVFYFVSCNPYLVQTGRPAPTALMTLSQFSEIFVMFAMPWFIAKLGLRKVLALGMAAWAIRYVCFASLSFPLAILGLLVHGFCYCFVFVGAYIYVDKRAPRDMRASAQSLIAFLMLGVAWFIGAQVAGFTSDQYPPLVKNMPATEQTDAGAKQIAEAPLPGWTDPDAGTSIWRFLDLSSTIQGWLTGDEAEASAELIEQLDLDNDGSITLDELEGMPEEGLKLGTMAYAKDDLVDVFTKISGSQQTVTRAEWLRAQSFQWTSIWLWPAGAAALIGLIFWLGSRDEKPEEEQEQPADDEQPSEDDAPPE